MNVREKTQKSKRPNDRFVQDFGAELISNRQSEYPVTASDIVSTQFYDPFEETLASLGGNMLFFTTQVDGHSVIHLSNMTANTCEESRGSVYRGHFDFGWGLGRAEPEGARGSSSRGSSSRACLVSPFNKRSRVSICTCASAMLPPRFATITEARMAFLLIHRALLATYCINTCFLHFARCSRAVPASKHQYKSILNTPITNHYR